MQQRIVICDTETAGLNPRDGVVEIALIEVDQNFEVIAKHYSLIDPEGPISHSASGIHGITSSMVADAPTLQQFFEIPEVAELAFQPLIVGGHNIKFDLGFIGGRLPDVTPFCTLRLARTLYPDAENHKLQTLRYILGLSAGDGSAHSAMSDTILCLNLARHMAQELEASPEDMVAFSRRPIDVKTMPFGKHKGLPIADVPKGYRNWLLDQPDVDPDLRFALTR